MFKYKTKSGIIHLPKNSFVNIFFCLRPRPIDNVILLNYYYYILWIIDTCYIVIILTIIVKTRKVKIIHLQFYTQDIQNKE